MRIRLAAWLVMAFTLPAQQPPQNRLHAVPKFPIASDPLTISRSVQPEKPFTVAGPFTALLGEQNGQFEAWLFPVKILTKSILSRIIFYFINQLEKFNSI